MRVIDGVGGSARPCRMPQERSSRGGPLPPRYPLFEHALVPEAITSLNIFARSKTMWMLPPLWTHRTRPQGFGNLAQNARFPQRPHRSSCSRKKKKNEEHNHSDQLSTESDQPQTPTTGPDSSKAYGRRMSPVAPVTPATPLAPFAG